VLVVWTALASLFAATLGYSRIPFAAARDGDFFPVFAKLHPRRHYPWVSLLALSALTAVFCYYPLDTVINAAVSVRIVVQFIAQIVALHMLRTLRPDVPMPFRMWLYPLPSLVALAGWLFVWLNSSWAVLRAGAGVVVAGVVVFFGWRAIAGRHVAEAGV